MIMLVHACTCTKPDAHDPTQGSASQQKVLEAAENETQTASSARVRAAAPTEGPLQIQIPSGKFIAGSTPGDKGRDPVLEPALLEVELGAFSIDRYLYPNEVAKPPLTGVTRQRASELCKEAGARLCTELEWERACKGPEGTAYAGADGWDGECAKQPMSCASGFGVLGMGAVRREWTSSDVAPVEEMVAQAASVRGAIASASDVDHRCAHRSAVDATTSADDIGFRCCRGEPNAAVIPPPKVLPAFQRFELSVEQLSEMLSNVKHLKDFGDGLEYFKEPDDTKVVLSRARMDEPPPSITLTASPLLWSPVPGEEVVVVVGKTDKNSFVVAFYRLADGRYRIASSLLMKGEQGPVALGYNSHVHKRLEWGICWDCRGESGNITYRKDNRVVITQE